MTISVTTLELGVIELPGWHPRSADRACLIQGYTIEHQSVLVQSGGLTTVLGGQCCYTCAEFEAGDVVAEDVHDETWAAAAGDSIMRLESFVPDVVHAAHDRTVIEVRP